MTENILRDTAPVTGGMLATIMQGLGIATRKSIDARIAEAQGPLLTRLATLELRTAALSMLLAGKGVGPDKVSEVQAMLERMKALEARQFGYGGVWFEGQQCNEGVFYTHGGSLWHCNATTQSRPGTDDTFTLCVKKGHA